MEYTTTIEISADVDTVWAALADPERWPDWMPGVTAVTPTEPVDASRYGAVYRLSQPWWKFDNQEIQIRDFEPPRRFVVGSSTSAGEFTFEYTLRQLPGGRTAVDHFVSSAGLGASLSDALGGSMIQKQLVAEAAQLRDHCEAATRGIAGPQDVVPAR